LISSNNQSIRGKADKLSYWLEDYIKFLTFEPKFDPSTLRRYKRGEIIKAHLGYNIGSEEGGLHYCVAIDKDNSIYSPVITIIPLTSVKPSTDLSKLRKGEVFLGNELFTNLNSKVSLHSKTLSDELKELQEALVLLKGSSNMCTDKIVELTRKMNSVKDASELLQRMRAEVLKMKNGSIALVNQISTISKIRIYDPKTNQGVLSGIKLSNEKLDAIDSEILCRYINHK
jgi:mRNA-degrading endonuclease toxin of MazEF toxin-antitoxin module